MNRFGLNRSNIEQDGFKEDPLEGSSDRFNNRIKNTCGIIHIFIIENFADTTNTLGTALFKIYQGELYQQK